MYETLQAIEPIAAVFPTPRLTKLIPRDRRRLSRASKRLARVPRALHVGNRGRGRPLPRSAARCREGSPGARRTALAAVRSNFVESPEYQKLERLRHDLEASQADLSAAEALAQTGLHKASAALEAGKDPSPAEKEYARAKINVEMLANRAKRSSVSSPPPRSMPSRPFGTRSKPNAPSCWLPSMRPTTRRWPTQSPSSGRSRRGSTWRPCAARHCRRQRRKAGHRRAR